MELSWKGGVALLVGAAFAMSMVVGTVLYFTPDAADITDQEPVTFEGEFEEHNVDELDAPFSNVNVFDAITPAVESDDDTLHNGEYAWVTTPDNELIAERSAVTYFEVDGDFEGLEGEIEEADVAEDVVIEEVTFYDYEAAEDENDLETGEQAVQQPQTDIDEVEAELENFGSVTDGEYALEIEYRFDGYTTPATDTAETLGLLTLEADTDGDIDEIEDTAIAVEGE